MRALVPLLLAVVLGACAGRAPRAPELFAVLPSEDGHKGAIAIHREGQTHVLDTPYAAERITSEGESRSVRLSADEVQREFGGTLQALPGRPAKFMLYFLEGKDELTVDSKAELEKVFSELKRRPLPDIVVIGHTDTVGGLTYNDKLSLARAERLREMLVGLGIPAERVSAAGRGKRELLVPTEDNVSEPRNRRVEINVR